MLYRQSADLEIRSDSEGARTVFGLAVPYNVTVPISDMSGSYDERFAPGAFRRSIAERGDKIRLLANHDARGKFPIGKATELRETDAGLEAAFFVPDTAAGSEALELVRTGVVDGFSVGFNPIRDERGSDGAVIRTEAALLEVSLTSFPAYATAAVAGVRSSSEVRARLAHTLRKYQP